jgi:hypothetical protein
MGTATKRRERQLALVTVASPAAGSALEQTARRAEAGDQTSPTPAGGCARAPTWCSALVAGRWPTG